MRKICSEFFAELVRQSICKRIKDRLHRKNGWGDRIRTHEWLDQNQLPYHLATPQRAQTQIKNTIYRSIYTVILVIFCVSFISCTKVSAAIESKYVSELKSRSNYQSPIEAMSYDTELIYSDTKNLYLGTKRIDLMNSFIGAMQEPSTNNERKIYQILEDGEDTWLATSIGLFKNYKRVFNKGSVREIQITRTEIYIATETGIYQALKTKTEDPKWTLVKGSPIDVVTIHLDNSDHLEYAASNLGFYYYDSESLRWLQRNAGLKKDFNDSYGFRKILCDKDHLLITTSSGVYQSKDQGLNWQRSIMGLKPNSDGFYGLRDITVHNDDIFLATSQGLYYAGLDQGQLNWQELELKQARSNENNSIDVYSLLSIDTELYAGTSYGEIFSISNLKPMDTKIEGLDFIRKLLSVEPSVQELQAVALAFAGLPAGQDFRRYRRQARLRNLLPNFESFGTHNAEDIIAINTSGGDDFNSGTGSLTSSYDRDSQNRNNSGLTSGIRANWQLGNLIYDPEINDINNSARIVSNIRENLLTELTQIYFARRELQYKILSEIFSQKQNATKTVTNNGNSLVASNEDTKNLNTATQAVTENQEEENQNNRLKSKTKSKKGVKKTTLSAKAKVDTIVVEEEVKSSPATDLEQLFKDKLKLAEYTAQIDARTGAWFSKELEKRYQRGIYEEYFGS